MSEKSSYWYDSSPVLGTTAQIIWNGVEVPCLNVCSGSRLTTLQAAILEKLCELVGDVDMSTVTIPCALEIAWNSQDPTILNYIQYLLEVSCAQKSILDGLTSTAYTSATTLDLIYCCCTPSNGCDTHVNVTISEHLENILTCLCKLKTEVASLKTEVEELYATKAYAKTLCERIGKIETGITAWNVANSLNKINISVNHVPCS